MPDLTKDEIEHVACECSQQDWNRLEYKEIYRKAFIDGANFVIESRQAQGDDEEDLPWEEQTSQMGYSIGFKI